jgi:hypothetical protein
MGEPFEVIPFRLISAVPRIQSDREGFPSIARLTDV